jgi:hypothetical protein
MSKFMSLEQTIRALGAKGASQPLEKDMNDQIHVGGYTSKHFEVSRDAQKLFAALPKDIDSDAAERSAHLHDKLFDLHKKVAASKKASKSDVDAAEDLSKKIMKIAKDINLEDKHGHVKDSVDFIKKALEGEKKDTPDADSVAKAFATPPKDYQSDVKSDADIDNMAKFRISRDKRAQRKLKIIDDQFYPGVTNMDRIENVSPSFLEAMKQVQANEKELAEKKLIGKQHKLDKNKNGELDAHDFELLRGKKSKMKAEDVSEAKQHNYTPEGINCPVCGMKACPPKAEMNEDNELDEGRMPASVIKHKTDLANMSDEDFAEKHGDKTEKQLRDLAARHGYGWNAATKTGSDHYVKRVAKGKKAETNEETLDEAQFVFIKKGMTRRRIRNNPVEIDRARKGGWAINMGDEVDHDGNLLDEAGNPMKALGDQQKKQVVQREVQQKKAMFAKKNNIDKQKFSKSMQNIKAGDEIAVDGEQIDEISADKVATAARAADARGYNAGENDQHRLAKAYGDQSDRLWAAAEKKRKKEKADREMAAMSSGKRAKMNKEEFIDRAIAILGEDFADATFEEIVTALQEARGRPRIHPPKDPNAPKKPRGRPKKAAAPVAGAKPAAKKDDEGDKDREHIVMGLRKAVSLRGQHHVKFANGETHQVPMAHAQRALAKHDDLKRPSEKMVFARKLAASKDSFYKALDDKNPGAEPPKKPKITLGKMN